MTNDPYAGFADLYDSEAGSGEIQNLFTRWRNHLNDAIRQYRIPVRIFVDLACGTGNSTIPWTEKKNWTIIGVDRSQPMLKEARKKSKNVRWVHQDLRELHLDLKADAATCHFDAINHILSAHELQKVFVRVAKILNKGGLFQFDISTDFFFRWLNGREKLFRVGENYFVASNLYDARKRIVTFHQLWFVRHGSVFKKREIQVQEAAYSQDQIRILLKKAGFRILKKFPTIRISGKTARLLYLVQKL